MTYETISKDARSSLTDSRDVLHKAEGFVRNLTIKDRGKQDPLYKFQVRYVDDNDQEREPDDWFSGFKNPPGQDGDYVLFKYKINGVYNNVKEVMTVKKTHEVAGEDDNQKLKTMDDQELSTGYDGTNVSTPKIPDDAELSKPYLAMLLNGTIHLCTKRGELTHAEIIAQFNRFLQVIGKQKQ